MLDDDKKKWGDDGVLLRHHHYFLVIVELFFDLSSANTLLCLWVLVLALSPACVALLFLCCALLCCALLCCAARECLNRSLFDMICRQLAETIKTQAAVLAGAHEKTLHDQVTSLTEQVR